MSVETEAKKINRTEQDAKKFLKEAIGSGLSILYRTDDGICPVVGEDSLRIVVVERSHKEVLALVDRFKKSKSKLRYASASSQTRMLAERIGFRGSQHLNVDVGSGSVVLFVKKTNESHIIDTADTTEKIIENFDFSLCVCG